MPGVLNKPKFWIRQSPAYDRVLNMRSLHSQNMPEYPLNEVWIYLGFKICQDVEYAKRARITQDSKYAMTECIWIRREYAWIYNNRQGCACFIQNIAWGHSTS